MCRKTVVAWKIPELSQVVAWISWINSYLRLYGFVSEESALNFHRVRAGAELWKGNDGSGETLLEMMASTFFLPCKRGRKKSETALEGDCSFLRRFVKNERSVLSDSGRTGVKFLSNPTRRKLLKLHTSNCSLSCQDSRTFGFPTECRLVFRGSKPQKTKRARTLSAIFFIKIHRVRLQ